MPVRLVEVTPLVTDLEREKEPATWSEHPGELGETVGNSGGGVWMIEYHATAPASDPLARSRSVIVPSENLSSGCAARATATMPGDRSMPKASRPRSRRWAVIRPGPHPRSATGPEPSASTSSAKVASIARSHGLTPSSSFSSVA